MAIAHKCDWCGTLYSGETHSFRLAVILPDGKSTYLYYDDVCPRCRDWLIESVRQHKGDVKDGYR